MSSISPPEHLAPAPTTASGAAVGCNDGSGPMVCQWPVPDARLPLHERPDPRPLPAEYPERIGRQLPQPLPHRPLNHPVVEALEVRPLHGAHVGIDLAEQTALPLRQLPTRPGRSHE